MIELTYIKNLLTQKENSFLEFKKAKTGIPKIYMIQYALFLILKVEKFY